MVRALALFLVVFSVLCLVVHLFALGLLFATGALSIFVIDQVVTQFVGPRAGRVRGEPLL